MLELQPEGQASGFLHHTSRDSEDAASEDTQGHTHSYIPLWPCYSSGKLLRKMFMHSTGALIFVTVVHERLPDFFV